MDSGKISLFVFDVDSLLLGYDKSPDPTYVNLTEEDEEEPTLMPGLAKLIHHLYKNNVPMTGIISSSNMSHFEGLCSMFNLCAVFNHTSKEIDYLACAKALEKYVKPKEVLAVLSDTVTVGPAADAGIKFAVLARTQICDTTERMGGEHHVEAGQMIFLRCASELSLAKYQLPPFGYRPVTHVIFDVDGLLLDTVGMYGEALRKVLKRHGKKPSWEFRMSIMGMRREDSLSKIIEFYNLPYSAEQLSDEFTRLTKKKMSHADMMEGAERLVNHLHKHGIPMAVATSSSQESYEAKTVHHQDIFSKFHHIATGSHPDIEYGKPAPDIFLICARLFDTDIDPAQCLVFEDAPNGVEAALAAGMQVVMIPDKRIPPERVRDATQLHYSLAEVHPEDFGLPPFDI